MNPIRKIGLLLLSAAGLLMLILAFYFLFQHDNIYKYSLGIIAGNYRNENGEIKKSRVPYEEFSPDKMFSWDANLYLHIKENGYDIATAGGDYIFAFFPLFPFVWKISDLTAVQISLINYFLWILSLIILTGFLGGKEIKENWKYILVLSGIPMLVVFLIPYSEGLYMLTLTVALWGLYKGKYVIYFIAAFLASMTRSSVTILMLALFFTEFHFFLRHRNFPGSVKSFVLKSLPLVTGTLIVSLIQFRYGSDHLTKFIEVEKYWGYALQWPAAITDWAHEQYCTNLPLAIIVLPILLLFIGYTTWKNLMHRKVEKTDPPVEPPDYKREYTYMLSLIYLTGIILTIIMLRGGSLNGISRYVFCTPFYIIALFMLQDKTAHVNTKTITWIFSAVFIIAVSALSLINYSRHWNFSDLGFILFFFQLAFFIFTKLISNRWLVAAFFVLSALWASYLFSMFVSNAWIIT